MNSRGCRSKGQRGERELFAILSDKLGDTYKAGTGIFERRRRGLLGHPRLCRRSEARREGKHTGVVVASGRSGRKSVTGLVLSSVTETVGCRSSLNVLP